MNLTKLILIGGVAIVGAISSPVAQARDHRDRDRDHRDHRDRYEYRHNHHRDFYRPYAYERRRGVIYRDGYYSQPRTNVTIAIGGHRYHRR